MCKHKFPPDGHPYFPPPYEKTKEYWWEPWFPIAAVFIPLGLMLLGLWGRL